LESWEEHAWRRVKFFTDRENWWSANCAVRQSFLRGGKWQIKKLDWRGQKDKEFLGPVTSVNQGTGDLNSTTKKGKRAKHQ